MPARGKTPKRIGRTRTPKLTVLKTPTRQTGRTENAGSPNVFKTPKIPVRSTRAGKTPGWYSPTEDTFKLPTSPSPPSKRVTRRSTVYKKAPEYSSFIALSPRRTRRSSVYQKKSADPAEIIQKATRRASMIGEKPKPPAATRRASVYKKKANEQLIENLHDAKLVKPSAGTKTGRQAESRKFSPIRTRRQSILPKNPGKLFEQNVPSRTTRNSRETQKASSKVPVPTKQSTVQKQTMSSAAKMRAKSKSPVKTMSILPNKSSKSVAEEQKTAFVEDLLDLVPKVARNSPKLVKMVRRASSALALSPMGARTKAVVRLEKIDCVVSQDAESSSVQDSDSPKSTRRGTKSDLDVSTPVLQSTKQPSPAQKDTPVALKRKTSKDAQSSKKQKLDESVYATPTYESPRANLRRKVASQIALSPATPEFLTPVGNLKKKRKATPMRPGLQKSLQLARSTPDVSAKETQVRPVATRKPRMRVTCTRETHGDEPVPVIDGKQVLDKKEFAKEGLDFVDADLVKEPLEVPSPVKTVDKPAQARAGRCTIL